MLGSELKCIATNRDTRSRRFLTLHAGDRLPAAMPNLVSEVWVGIEVASLNQVTDIVVELM